MNRYKKYMDHQQVSASLHQRLLALEEQEKAAPEPLHWKRWASLAACCCLVAGMFLVGRDLLVRDKSMAAEMSMDAAVMEESVVEEEPYVIENESAAMGVTGVLPKTESDDREELFLTEDAAIEAESSEAEITIPTPGSVPAQWNWVQAGWNEEETRYIQRWTDAEGYSYRLEWGEGAVPDEFYVTAVVEYLDIKSGSEEWNRWKEKMSRQEDLAFLVSLEQEQWMLCRTDGEAMRLIELIESCFS